MALDGAMLGIIKKDLNDTALGARIEKITMPYKDLICLFLNKPNFKKTLLISTNPNSARIHFTNEKFENPKVPPMLCMLLRKRLAGGRLKSVSQYGIDRVLILQFDCKNELGDDAVISVVVEMFGRLSNVIFTENGKIIDALKRVDPSENKRFILPNAVYEFPQKQDRLNLFETDTESVIERIKTQTGKTALQAISSVIDGLSPVIYREFCFKSVGDFEKPVED
ncbi:MAG: NFACT family protein, partial [Clostridia bacterium]|nr:NFACT family protein [Clostridia bacterium]